MWTLGCCRVDRPAWLATGGVALGLALLAKSLLGAFVPILVLPLLAIRPRRQALARLALFAIPAALVVAPVVVANGFARGAWIVSDSSRFNVWVGLVDNSRKSFIRDPAGREYQAYLESAPDFHGRNRQLVAKIRDRVRSQGIGAVLRENLSRQYFRLFDRDSFLTDQLPGGVLHGLGSGYKDASHQLAATVRTWTYVHYAVVLVAASLGLALLPGWPKRDWSRVIVAFLAYNLLIFLVLHVKSRYRLQFVPFLDALAGAALAVAWSRATGAESVPISRRWAVAAVLLAALLLFLAFGGAWLPT